MPGAARAGSPGAEPGVEYDLHQPSFDIDERAIGVGVRVMTATALAALWDSAASPEPPARERLAGAADSQAT